MAVLTASLMPHQVTCRDWTLKHEGDGGCILALGMGMGKTVISISVMIASQLPTLVILPLSLLTQWSEEIKKHSSFVSVGVYHGATRTLTSEYDIVLTTYNTIVSDLKKGRTDHYKQFKRIIIDEAHKLRTKKSKAHQAIAEVFKEVKNKILLTGTPICNSPDDLISLFMILNIEPLNTEEYWCKLPTKKIENLIEAKDKAMLYMTLEKVMPDHLPPLTIVPVDKPFAKDEQKGFYTDILTGHMPTKYKIQKITKLRQCANHVNLLKNEISCDMSEKVTMVKNIIVKVPEDEKIVVFSQWYEMLSLLKDNIEEKSVVFHGKMKISDKTSVIKEFQEDPSVRILFITLKAGSVGLNLTAANHAILVEPYFNAAEENQAMKRIHRIGQTKEVKVYKLHVSNTIENWMVQMKKVKTRIENKILTNSGTIEEITTDNREKLDMFDMYVNNNTLETEE